MKNLCIILLLLTPLRGAELAEGKDEPPSLKEYSEIVQLARAINCESKYEPMLGKIAVGNVIVNRSRRRGLSLKRIIEEPGQFDGVRTKFYREWPSKHSMIAAKAALSNQVIPESVEFFHNPRTSTDSRWLKYIERFKYRQIGQHLFCHNPHYVNKD